jgi:hypothetical protein
MMPPGMKFSFHGVYPKSNKSPLKIINEVE